MLPIKILAVEDDPLYVEALRIVIDELGYRLVAITDNMIETVHAVRHHQPDLILMDIQINDTVNGIELSKMIRGITTAPIIFVTAFKDRAVIDEAKLIGPAAYIIKPYESESLQAAIELAIFGQGDRIPLSPPSNFDQSFYVKDNQRLIKVKIDDIIIIEVDEKYCYIDTEQKRVIINIRLKELLEKLPVIDFLQIHRSFIVRKSKISEVNNGANEVVLTNKKKLPIGRTYKKALLKSLNLLSN